MGIDGPVDDFLANESRCWYVVCEDLAQVFVFSTAWLGSVGLSTAMPPRAVTKVQSKTGKALSAARVHEAEAAKQKTAKNQKAAKKIWCKTCEQSSHCFERDLLPQKKVLVQWHHWEFKPAQQRWGPAGTECYACFYVRTKFCKKSQFELVDQMLECEKLDQRMSKRRADCVRKTNKFKHEERFSAAEWVKSVQSQYDDQYVTGALRQWVEEEIKRRWPHEYLAPSDAASSEPKGSDDGADSVGRHSVRTASRGTDDGRSSRKRGSQSTSVLTAPITKVPRKMSSVRSSSSGGCVTRDRALA